MFKNNENAMPSFDEVMGGILKWYLLQLHDQIKYKSKHEQKRIIRKCKHTFLDFMKSMAISDTSKPMDDL